MTAPVILVLSPFQEKLKLKIKETDIRENPRDEDNEVDYLHMKVFFFYRNYRCWDSSNVPLKSRGFAVEFKSRRCSSSSVEQHSLSVQCFVRFSILN